MATRCNVKISDEKNRLYLYRHWDGYLAETGAEVYEIADKVKEMSVCIGTSRTLQAINRFFGSLEFREHENKWRCRYELTEWTHGDIEHFYHIVFLPDGKVRVGHVQGYGSELEFQCNYYELDDFKEIVNEERNQFNRNMEGIKEEDESYSDYEPYQML